ncbi:uncharacterized protein [Triticum aestivum]|uniref:uncharacterized protein isoform X1 n=1 Tax=Triticum aestivum TaxID=4565 RepID=UPI001D01E9B3|nr:uncharacterized protein LOC123172701 isoform X1 [Triticum aestivum]
MDMRMRVSVISAPRLATLGYISQDSQDSKIMFGSTVIQRLRVVSLTTVVPTIKILAVNMNSNLDMVIELMKCFVCLEKLYMKIQTDSPAGTNFWRHKHRNFLTSQNIRLKTLVLGHYRGIQAQNNVGCFRWRKGFLEVLSSVLQQVLTMMFRAPLTSMIWIWLIRSHVDVERGAWLLVELFLRISFCVFAQAWTKRRWPESAIL